MNTHKQIQSAVKEFRQQFLVKGSECTWEGYPNPDEFEDFLTQKLQQLAKQKDEEFMGMIGEDEEEKEEEVKTVDGSYDVTIQFSEERNRMRAELRNKLWGGKDEAKYNS